MFSRNNLAVVDRSDKRPQRTPGSANPPQDRKPSNRATAPTGAPGRRAAAAAIVSTRPPVAAGNLLSLHRAIGLLSVVADSERGMRLTDAANATGLSPSTTHRILSALVQHGLLRIDETSRHYLPGGGLLRLGSSAARHFSLVELARPSLQRIASETQDTVSLSVIDGVEALCLHRIVGSYPIKTMTLAIGERRPLGVGAGGLALLAALPKPERNNLITAQAYRREANFPAYSSEALGRWADEAERRGFAHSSDRVLHGMSGVGVAILGADQRPRGSLSVSGISSRIKGERMKKIVDLLKRECALLAEH